MQDPNNVQRDSAGWLFYVKTAFIAAVCSTYLGIYFIPASLWVKGYMAMAVLFVIGSSITLSKTLRDQHEADRLINRIAEAKTQKILKEYGPDD